ncbi:MAG: hypothetical protein WAM60_24150 [Candidatus Promineifilaceae bacterium]
MNTAGYPGLLGGSRVGGDERGVLSGSAVCIVWGLMPFSAL